MPSSEQAAGQLRPSRREVILEQRSSKRPSRGGRPAGATEQPDHQLTDAGLTALLRRSLARARAASGLPDLFGALLTLDGQLQADIGRRALTVEELTAIDVLTRPGRVAPATGDTVFTSAVALSPSGRLVLTVPRFRSLPREAAEVGVAERVAWGTPDMAEYERLITDADAEAEREVNWLRSALTAAGAAGRTEIISALRGAVSLLPPVLFYRGMSMYSNLRDSGNLTGKTLLSSHPDCFFHHLDKLPSGLWTDDEIVIVGCLYLLYLSGGPNRLESCNGFQLSLGNVTDNLRGQARLYADAGYDIRVPDGPVPVAELRSAALQLAQARLKLVRDRDLYYEINATTRRKAERLFSVRGVGDAHLEQVVCERLERALPAPAASFDELLSAARRDPGWLAAPAAGQPTRFEALIESTVRAALDLMDADYAMSRGLRSLPRLADALAARDWAEIVSWELPSFYCCVVPSSKALRLFDGDYARLADSTWAIAARMQYNTWHVMPGNLPKNPSVQARDFLAPHALPDIAIHSDLHHRGHVANNIRFSARSPETVEVAGLLFKSLTDIRVLRCEGPEFTEPELRAVTRMARFVADLSQVAADHAAAGRRVEVTSFDHRWYRATIIEKKLALHA